MKNQYHNFITMANESNVSHHDHHLVYISIISIVISLLSFILTSWIAWKYTNYKNRRKIIIDKINSNLLIINSTIDIFNNLRILNEVGEELQIIIPPIQYQFPKIFNYFLIYNNANQNISQNISNEKNYISTISFSNLKLISSIFEILRIRLSKLISEVMVKFMENIQGDKRITTTKLKKEIDKSIDYRKIIKFYLCENIPNRDNFDEPFYFHIKLDDSKQSKLSIKLFGFNLLRDYRDKIKSFEFLTNVAFYKQNCCKIEYKNIFKGGRR